MHLDIGLSLLSEVEQLRKKFWEAHQNHVHTQDKPSGSQESSRPQSPDHSQLPGNADNDRGHHPLSHILDQCHMPNSQHHPQDSSVTRSENNQKGKDSRDQTCCKSENNEANQHKKYSHQPQEETTPTQPSPSTGLRRTCSALWDRTAEGSSLLWILILIFRGHENKKTFVPFFLMYYLLKLDHNSYDYNKNGSTVKSPPQGDVYFRMTLWGLLWRPPLKTTMWLIL